MENEKLMKGIMRKLKKKRTGDWNSKQFSSDNHQMTYRYSTEIGDYEVCLDLVDYDDPDGGGWESCHLRVFAGEKKVADWHRAEIGELYGSVQEKIKKSEKGRKLAEERREKEEKEGHLRELERIVGGD